jgi:hypothetical protein
VGSRIDSGRGCRFVGRDVDAIVARSVTIVL